MILAMTRRQRKASRQQGLHQRIERRALRSAGSFVKTPTGREAVVEVHDGNDLFVRYEDGSHCWLSVVDCEVLSEAPSWYRSPALAELSGGRR